jgi:hypothetical protein
VSHNPNGQGPHSRSIANGDSYDDDVKDTTALEPSSNGALEWSAHPARQRPLAALTALVVCSAFAAIVWVSFGAGWSVLSIVVLVLSLHRFFFSSRFVIDAQGVSATYLLRRQRLRWSDVRRFVSDERGGYLSTRSALSRWDAFGGIHIIFNQNRQRVIDEVNRRRAQVAVSSGQSGLCLMAHGPSWPIAQCADSPGGIMDTACGVVGGKRDGRGGR